jgi:hypothetical protein
MISGAGAAHAAPTEAVDLGAHPLFAGVVQPLSPTGQGAVDLAGFQCPAETPWLASDVGTQRWVPAGVDVRVEDTAVRAQIDSAATFDPDSGRVTGWADAPEFVNSVKNSGFTRAFAEVTAHCTDDPARAASASSPTFTSADRASFTGWTPFTVTTTGFPKPRFTIVGGELLPGLEFRDHGDGTASIERGSVEPGLTGSVTVEASNGFATSTQRITLAS